MDYVLFVLDDNIFANNSFSNYSKEEPWHFVWASRCWHHHATNIFAIIMINRQAVVRSDRNSSNSFRHLSFVHWKLIFRFRGILWMRQQWLTTVVRCTLVNVICKNYTQAKVKWKTLLWRCQIWHVPLHFKQTDGWLMNNCLFIRLKIRHVTQR